MLEEYFSVPCWGVNSLLLPYSCSNLLFMFMNSGCFSTSSFLTIGFLGVSAAWTSLDLNYDSVYLAFFSCSWQNLSSSSVSEAFVVSSYLNCFSVLSCCYRFYMIVSVFACCWRAVSDEFCSCYLWDLICCNSCSALILFFFSNVRSWLSSIFYVDNELIWASSLAWA